MRSGAVRIAASVVAAGGMFAALSGWGAAHAFTATSFGLAQPLATSDGGTEPRVAVTPDGKHYVISNTNGTATVWESDDGTTNWHITGAIANQTLPTIDVDIVSTPAGSTHPGRLIATELDTGGLNFRTSYSDDGGAHWTQSNLAGITLVGGTQFADQDRQWLATGPHDRVYLLFHNLTSGTLSHNMYVSTSTDNGASFGPPIPVTTPPTQAFQDLQCADSGGPSDLFVNQTTGRVYAVFGTRSAVVGGGCVASISGSLEVNVVAATRVWIASADEGSTTLPTGWTQSLAVDDNPSGKIVGMQLAPAAIDSAGNVYVVYPESPGQYPVYDGAAVKYVHATESDIKNNPYGITGPAAQVWSQPVTVAPQGGAGHLLPHIVAGGPGQIDMAYFEGDEISGSTPATKASWYLVVAQTVNALDAVPTITTQRINYPGSPAGPRAVYSGFTASQMMGACSSNGVQNGFLCNRSTDVWGIGLDNNGNLLLAWPAAPANSFGCSACNDTFVITQTSGTTIGPGGPAANVPDVPWTPAVALLGFGVAAVVPRLRRSRKRRPLP